MITTGEPFKSSRETFDKLLDAKDNMNIVTTTNKLMKVIVA